uniref:Putative helix-turn-helix domain-containing protein n=1 Tax=Rhodococcus sp. Mel TaxID=1093626 RepID=H8ZKU2_9NOCA|nr:putative helix-turn-helix domain-containing protein [Rhodococcus sp. Mel]
MQYIARMAEGAALAVAIGSRVRHERLARQWTLDQLTEASGVSRRMLINVEQGAANPSVGTLLKISEALGIGLPTLVEPPQHRPVAVTRNGEGAALWRGQDGGRGVLVASTVSPDAVELWDWTLGPGDRHDSDPHTAGTKELMHVREGEITVAVAEHLVDLKPGDAVAYPGDVPHSYINSHTTPARFALTVFEPGARAPQRLEVNDA